MKITLISATVVDINGIKTPVDMGSRIKITGAIDNLSIPLKRLTKADIDRIKNDLKTSGRKAPITTNSFLTDVSKTKQADTLKKDQVIELGSDSSIRSIDISYGRITRSRSRAMAVSSVEQNEKIIAESKEESVVVEKRSKSHTLSVSPVVRDKRSISDSNEETIVAKRRKIDSDPINQKNNVVAELKYRIGEAVWAKIRGYKSWPAKIIEIINGKKTLYRISWFNDYRTSTVYNTQMFKFCKNFDRFASGFENHIGLEVAAKEALIYLAQKKTTNDGI